MGGSRIVLLAVVLSVGCVRNANTRATGWRELRTEDIVLRTDVSEPAAVDLAKTFQGIRDAFDAVAFPCARGVAMQPTEITVFARDVDYEMVGGRTTGGFHRRPRTKLLDRQPQLVVRDRQSSREQLVFQHELTHRFMAACYPGSPPWLNEGLAGFYETMELHEGFVRVGLPAYLFTDLARPFMHSNLGREVLAFPKASLPRVEALLRMDYAAFYGAEADGITRTGHYAASWALAYMLELGEEDLKARYRQVMAGGGSAEQVQRHLADVDLQSRFNTFIRARRLSNFDIPYAPAEIPTPALRELSAAEGHLLLADLLPWDEESAPVVNEHLAFAAQEAPGHTAALRAAYMAYRGELESASVAIAEAEVAPIDPETAYSVLAWTTYVQRAPFSPAQVDEAAAYLETAPPTASRYQLLARHALSKGLAEKAIEWGVKSLREDRTCWSCFEAVGASFEAANDPSRAIQAYERALALVPHGLEPVREALTSAILRAASNTGA